MAKKRNGKFFTDIRPRVNGVPTGERVRKLIPKVKYQWEADEAERKIAASIMYGAPQPEDVPTVEQFCEEVFFPHIKETLSQHANAQVCIRSFLPFFKGRKIDTLSPFDAERFKAAMLKRECRRGGRRASGTVNNDLAHLSSICKLAVKRGYLKTNPCAEVEYLELSPHKVRFLTDGEEAALMKELASPSPYMVSVARVALGTGLRLNELLNLKVEHIDFGTRRLYVEKPKWRGDKRRSEGVPLSAVVAAELERLCAGRTRGHVFLCTLNRPPVGATVQIALRRALKRAGILNFRFHDLRHTFGSRLGQAGVSPYVIARLMGHADIKRTMVYVHLTERDERDAVELIWGQKSRSGRHVAPQGGVALTDAPSNSLTAVG